VAKEITIFMFMIVIALLIIDEGISILNRPQIIIDRETKQLIKATFPDEGKVVVITDYRDPRYLLILKNGEYDSYEIR
jgi:hypothetical protein